MSPQIPADVASSWLRSALKPVFRLIRERKFSRVLESPLARVFALLPACVPPRKFSFERRCWGLWFTGVDQSRVPLVVAEGLDYNREVRVRFEHRRRRWGRASLALGTRPGDWVELVVRINPFQ
jgi:hypothetical protein